MSSLTTASHPDRLPRIVAVGRWGLHRVLERIAPAFAAQARIDLLERAFDDAAEALRAEHARDPIDAVVAAGASGAHLRRVLDLPLALVEVRGLDLLAALAEARALGTPVALASHGGPSPALERFGALFGLDIRQFGYADAAGARDCVAELVAAGIRAVVAPGLITDLAAQAGIATVLVHSDDAVRQAFDDALRLARQARAVRARSERLGTILAQLQDGVAAVDATGRIEAVNPAMARWLGGLPPAALLGAALDDIAPPLALADVLAGAAAAPPPGDEVLRLDGHPLVVRRAPIVEQGAVTGALVVAREAEAIQHADRRLRATARAAGSPARWRIDDFAGDGPAARQVRALAQRCAASDATVLIAGESGSGKELLAQGIHRAGARAGQPFLAVNCAALGESLLESELFGYEEGAFTGARRGGKPGLVEAAHTGTLFLDEIGDMPLPLQTRLLRVLQEREVLRIGATQPVPVDVRVIAATHAELERLVAEGRFRRDLFYRLAVLRLAVPPLRARREDIAPLARRLLARRGAAGAAAEPLLPVLLEAAAGHGWPGNVRELDNAVERLVACADWIAGDGPGGIDAARLADLFPEWSDAPAAAPAPPLRGAPLREARRQAEWQRVREALAATGGDQQQACALLGISRATLWRRLREMEGAGV